MLVAVDFAVQVRQLASMLVGYGLVMPYSVSLPVLAQVPRCSVLHWRELLALEYSRMLLVDSEEQRHPHFRAVV